MSGTLLVGIGSSHGDDRVGWSVAQSVADRAATDARVLCARTPAELLDWMAGIEVLHVCDAVLSGSPPGTIHHWRWPAAEIQRVPFAGSHTLGLHAALALAEELGYLPGEVHVWGIAIERPQPLGELSAVVAAAVPIVAECVGRSVRGRAVAG